MEIRRVSLPARHYLYVDRDCALDGAAIASAMGSGMAEVMEFAKTRGIAPQGPPLTVYAEMPSHRLRFRCGVFVDPADSEQAKGAIRAGVLPQGEALTLTHLGPYAGLNRSHAALRSHMEEKGIALAGPVWEVYVDDPHPTPEPDLRTEIYYSVAQP